MILIVGKWVCARLWPATRSDGRWRAAGKARARARRQSDGRWKATEHTDGMDVYVYGCGYRMVSVGGMGVTEWPGMGRRKR